MPKHITDVRKTIIGKKSEFKKMDAIAYWERLTIKDAFSLAMKDYIDKYENKNGPIKLPG